MAEETSYNEYSSARDQGIASFSLYTTHNQERKNKREGEEGLVHLIM